MGQSNFLNNGSLDSFLTGLGGAVVNLANSPSMQGALSGVVAVKTGVESQDLAGVLGANAAKPSASGADSPGFLQKLFDIYKKDKNGAYILEGGKKVVDWLRVGLLGAGMVALFWIVKKVFFRSRKKKSSKKGRF